MGGNLKDRWSIPVTAVADEFIDTYMAAANGEYVKVYLYVLRHQGEDITIELIADALNHTESDVRRALSYWEKAGVLIEEFKSQSDGGKTVGDSRAAVCRGEDRTPVRSAPDRGTQVRCTQVCGTPDHGEQDCELQTHSQQFHDSHGNSSQSSVSLSETATAVQEGSPRPVYSPEQVNRLSQDEEFSQLLYIAQKYMNKVFTPRDCQVFAYLYEDLSMSSELLEYLVEYCVQNGHTSVRYIETVAMSWHEKGLKTAQEAKDYSASYSRDSFAVMKAFGINNRKPAAPEQKLMDKWFKDYGFSRDVVLEACDRTITAIHNPSFQYADKILSDWKKAGVKGLAEVKEMDARRLAARDENGESREKRLWKYDSGVSTAKQGNSARKNTSNQFHNFKQRDTDYDALVLKQVKEWVGQQP